MKRIINGRKYDTETAKELGYWANSGNCRDFNYLAETLYRKRTGEFFLYGEGGLMTKYAVNEGSNSWSGGARIMPISFDEARAWAEEHLDGDEYEAIFGEVEDDETRKVVAVNLKTSSVEIAKRVAAQKGVSVSALIDELIDGIQ